MIVIVDYGMGNLKSISNMLNKIGAKNEITNQEKQIRKAEKLILPGVGSFDFGIKNIKNLNLFDCLNQKVLIDKTPILGICLGMQLFTKSSEEGKEKGFGWIDAETKKFDIESLKTPHMGWNTIDIKKKSSLFNNNISERRYYFVHSYYVECNVKEDILASTDYSISFTSMIEKENIYGSQFHPEKSHNFGMEILNQFSII